MSIIIFVAGLVIGALTAFVFMFIVMGLSSRKNRESPKGEYPDAKLIREMWTEYLKETKDDGK